MKKTLNRLSLPFFLIVGYLSHILFLFYSSQRIPNIADSVIIGFLSILYGFSLFMRHIKKPDEIEVLRKEFADYKMNLNNVLIKHENANIENMKIINGKVGAMALGQNMKNPTTSGLGW